MQKEPKARRVESLDPAELLVELTRLEERHSEVKDAIVRHCHALLGDTVLSDIPLSIFYDTVIDFRTRNITVTLYRQGTGRADTDIESMANERTIRSVRVNNNDLVIVFNFPKEVAERGGEDQEIEKITEETVTEIGAGR